MNTILIYGLIVLALIGIALGRLPRLRMNRASMTLAFSALLIAAGALNLEEALAAVDVGTLALLLAMMLIIANLRLGGFFTWAGARILARAKGTETLLGLVVLSSGLLSALFLNDTICLMLTPLVAELSLRSKRDPLPYLIGVATAANVGSAATIIGNPQNMLIGQASGIEFARFLFRLAPPSIFGLAVVWLVIRLAFPAEFRSSSLLPAPISGEGLDRRLIAKSLGAALVMIVLLFAGLPPALAALVAAAILLFTRRVEAEKVFREVDFTLLVFFAGLFIITRSIASTEAFTRAVAWAKGATGESLGLFAVFSGAFSNLISNVPAVMLLSPLVDWFRDRETAWLVLAMASTYAGNLTLLGSVANLIVAEGARPYGVELSFGKYLRVGLPVTLITTAAGTAWLLLV